MPLEDLVVSDPYQSTMQKIVSGRDIGPTTVLGTPCEHLAFSLGAVDFGRVFYGYSVIANAAAKRMMTGVYCLP